MLLKKKSGAAACSGFCAVHVGSNSRNDLLPPKCKDEAYSANLKSWQTVTVSLVCILVSREERLGVEG